MQSKMTTVITPMSAAYSLPSEREYIPPHEVCCQDLVSKGRDGLAQPETTDGPQFFCRLAEIPCIGR